MRNVLMVAYMFPPIGGIGVQRTVQFAKYLPQYGWRPTILTVTESDDFMLDADLGDALPPEVTIYRARTWEPLNVARAKQVADRVESGRAQSHAKQRLIGGLKTVYAALRLPDDKIGWWPQATKLGKAHCRPGEDRPDLCDGSPVYEFPRCPVDQACRRSTAGARLSG